MRAPARTWIVLVVVIGFCGVVAAAQSALSSAELVPKDIQDAVAVSIFESGAPLPMISRASSALIKVMGPEARAAVMREALPLIKSFVMSSAFQTVYTEQIKKTHRAVDHGGINPDTYGMSADPMADVQRTVAMSVVSMIRMQNDAAVREIYENERQELAETIKSETGEERAKAQKDLARLTALAPMMKANPAEFKRAYSLAKSVAIGGPSTEAELSSGSASDADKQKIRDEQRAWNTWNFKTVMKAKLTAWIGAASTANFAAPTRMDGTKRVFVNAADEKMSPEQKTIFRLGKAPASVALDFARAWLKEL